MVCTHKYKLRRQPTVQIWMLAPSYPHTSPLKLTEPEGRIIRGSSLRMIGRGIEATRLLTDSSYVLPAVFLPYEILSVPDGEARGTVTQASE
jgi:hypothetical protein